MPDDPVPQSTPAPQTGQSPQATPFTMPEKFAGKSAEDIARAYTEMERQMGTQASRLGDLDAYSKIGSAKDISEALDWARNMKAALDRGLIVPAGQKPAAQTTPAAPSRPWEDEAFAYKTPKEQFDAVYEHGRNDFTQYAQQLAQQYQTQLQQQVQALTQQDARQKAILMKAMEMGIRNPSVSPTEMLTEAATLATKTPEELIDMVLAARANGPEAIDKRVNDAVAAKLAERIQEHEAKQLADITSMATPKPKGLGARVASNGLAAREAENRSIIDSLRKMDISLL